MNPDERAPGASSRAWRSRMLGCLVSAAIGCSAPDPGETVAAAPYDPEPVTGLSTGAVCASELRFSYDNLGLAFMRSYCLGCHSAAFVGSARRAPPDKNFDDVAGIRLNLRLIDQQAGAGPSAVHGVMPPEGPQPSLVERQRLSGWLACGAP